jgi:hypothetical protein
MHQGGDDAVCCPSASRFNDECFFRKVWELFFDVVYVTGFRNNIDFTCQAFCSFIAVLE